MPLDVVTRGMHDPLVILDDDWPFRRARAGQRRHGVGRSRHARRPGRWWTSGADFVTFRKPLPKLGLEVTKTFRLAQVPAAEAADADYPAYHLTLEIAIANTSDQPHEVAYRLDGPTGLPLEGYWYANKVSRTWGAAGMRDVIVHFNGQKTTQFSTSEISAADFDKHSNNSPLDFIAVDGIYFSSALLPHKPEPTDVLFEEVRPIRVGDRRQEQAPLTDVSFRLDSVKATLAPGGKPLKQQLQIFVGPKQPPLLSNYSEGGASLSDLVYYGWFGWVAEPMLALLHAFYRIVGNYGIAIIMLTVLVRSVHVPAQPPAGAQRARRCRSCSPRSSGSRKSTRETRPSKTKAQQELFRKHNYNPLAGCLPVFVQLPIFVGLYRSLMVDVELRQAPLFSESIRWASNLAAPDMLWNWTAHAAEFIIAGTGIFGWGRISTSCRW